MASFIPALSLFILVLFNGYFTLPIVDEQLSSSTFSSLNDDLTTEHAFNLRLVPDDETSVLPDMDKKGLIGGHLGFEASTSFFNAPEENVDQAIRAFDELFTTESTTFTTESSLPDKRAHHDFLFDTFESTLYTSESPFAEQEGYSDSSITTPEPSEPLPQLEIRSFTNESENETESETDKREIQVDFTTNDMLSFTSTASSVAPEWYTSQSSTSTSTSTSTEKYTGLLKYKHVNQEEQEQEQEPEESTKLTKTFKKLLTTKSTYIQPEDQSAEDPKEPTAPTAVFDQGALTKLSDIPNDFMVLDENNTLVVTDLPEKYSTSTIRNKKEQQPLTQGKESLQSEEKESRH